MRFIQNHCVHILYLQNIKGEMIIEDVTGKPLSAMNVFAKSIEALMQHLFGIFDQRGIKIKKTEIRWVLTVPAIWSDAAKQFMRKSAELVRTIFTLIRAIYSSRKCSKLCIN